jgi:hypothetical protein
MGGFAGGDAGHRREAQIYLRDTWHIGYGIDAISKLFRRRRTKLNARITATAPPSRRPLKNELMVSRLAVHSPWMRPGLA